MRCSSVSLPFLSQVQRRAGKKPPIPKRSMATSLSGRHSLSSSTSSLSSNPSGFTEAQAPQLPPKRSRLAAQVATGQRLSGGVSLTDSGEEEVAKRYSVDDITSALDTALGQNVEVRL